MANVKIEKGPQDFKLEGPINFDTVMTVYKQGTALLRANQTVQFDFLKITQVDSSAIALLLNWLRYAKSCGKTFTFTNLPGQMLDIANTCEVMPYLTPYIR